MKLDFLMKVVLMNLYFTVQIECWTLSGTLAIAHRSVTPVSDQQRRCRHFCRLQHIRIEVSIWHAVGGRRAHTTTEGV